MPDLISLGAFQIRDNPDVPIRSGGPIIGVRTPPPINQKKGHFVDMPIKNTLLHGGLNAELLITT